MPDYKVTFTEEITYQVIITHNPNPEYDENEEISDVFFEKGHYNDDNIIDTSSLDLQIEKITN